MRKALRLNVGSLTRKSKAALILSKIVESDLSQVLLDMSMKQDIDYALLINEIEKFGSDTQCRSIEEIISIVDYALRISFSGYLKYENQNNTLKLHSHSKDRSIVPWALIIVVYQEIWNTLRSFMTVGTRNKYSVHKSAFNVIQLAE